MLFYFEDSIMIGHFHTGCGNHHSDLMAQGLKVTMSQGNG